MNCTHNKFYYNKLMCNQTYDVVIKMHIVAVFAYLKH